AGPVIVRVLGAAGAAYAAPLIAILDLGDETIAHEALRALARVGNGSAATAVGVRLHSHVAWLREAAEDALWQFPPAQVAAQLRKLLARRAFVTAYPDAAGRMLERATLLGITGLTPALAAIAPLRFRFWNPALVRVALKARHLLRP